MEAAGKWGLGDDCCRTEASANRANGGTKHSSCAAAEAAAHCKKECVTSSPRFVLSLASRTIDNEEPSITGARENWSAAHVLYQAV